MTGGAAVPAIRAAVPVVSTEKQLAGLVEYYLQQGGFAFDVETQGEDRLIPATNDVAWISLATNGRADTIPMGHRNGELIEYRAQLLKSGRDRLAEGKTLRGSDMSRSEKNRRPVFTDPPAQLSRTTVFSALAPLFSSDLEKVAHNAKFDSPSIAKYLGFEPPNIKDTLIAESLLDSATKQLDLEGCVKKRLGFAMVKGVGKDITLHSFSEVAKYSLLDSKMTWLLWKVQRALLEERGMLPLLDLEMDVQRAIIEMQATGTRVDRGAMLIFRDEIQDELERARMKVYTAAGHEFAFTPAGKIHALFAPKSEGGQGLKPKKFTAKTNQPSTDAKHLESFSRNPLAKAMLEYAEYEKLMSTYLTPYLGGEGKVSLLRNGRVHTSFNQIGAETGRMSSSGPNLQNIPSRGKYGKRVRGLFVADPGHVLVVGDYSQIEPRIIASLSQDPVMIEAYMSGKDLYQAIADQLSITRAAGKELVLSMAYGVGAETLAERIDGVNVTKARELLSEFEREFRAVGALKRRVVAQARRRGYVETILGRRRTIRFYRGDGGHGERQAFNTLIQGSAADVMKVGMVRAHAMLPDEARLLLTVHDELVAQTPEELAEETVDRMREAMEGVRVSVLTVPLKADVHSGKSWAEAK